MSCPHILVPLAVTDAMLTSSTVAEPAAGETVWVSGGANGVGELKIRTETHRVYQCELAHTGITTPPESDPTRWRDIAPTARWAMLDGSGSTMTTATTALTAVIHAGCFADLSFYRLQGTALQVSVKTAPGGSIFFDQTIALEGPYLDWAAWLTGPRRVIKQKWVSGIVPYYDAELTITISGPVGETVGIGMVAIGTMTPLIVDSDFGGTRRGAKVEPLDYSLVTTNGYGDTTIWKRPSARDLRFSAILERAGAEYALGLLDDVRSTPVAVIATRADGFAPLNTFGLVSGSLTYGDEGVDICNLDMTVKGLI